MSFDWKHQENTLFHFDCYSEGNASIKKGQCKNLAQAINYKDTPKGTLQNVSSEHASQTITQCQTRNLKSTDYIGSYIRLERTNTYLDLLYWLRGSLLYSAGGLMGSPLGPPLLSFFFSGLRSERCLLTAAATEVFWLLLLNCLW